MKHKNPRKINLYLLALAPFLILVVMFELAPLGSILVKSFRQEQGGGFSLENYMNIFSKPFYQQAILNSVIISVAASIIGMAIAFFGAKAARASEGIAKRIFMSILNMTSNFAGVPLAFGFIILLGKTGVLVLLGKEMGIEWLAQFDLYTSVGLTLTYIYFQIPIATLLLIPAFDVIKDEWQEAAKILKASSWQFWRHIGIPTLLPSILSTFSVLFANALAAYATAYALLTGNISLLPIRISELFVGDLVQRPELGSALSVVLMLLMLAAFGINNYFIKRLRKEGERR